MSIIIFLLIMAVLIALFIKSYRRCPVCGKRGGVEQRSRTVENINEQEDQELEFYYYCKYCEEETRDKEDARQLFYSDFLNSKSVVFFSDDMKSSFINSELIEVDSHNKNINILETIHAEFVKIYNDVVVIYIEEKNNEYVNNARRFMETFKYEYIEYGKELFEDLDYSGIAIYKCKKTNNTSSLKEELEFDILAKLYMSKEKADKTDWDIVLNYKKIDDSIFDMIWMDQ